jgi:hypothetical protein
MCEELDGAELMEAIYDQAVAKLDGDDCPMEHSFAHIVWGDGNYRNSDIEYCLKAYSDPDFQGKYTQEQMDIVKWSLEEALKIPETIRLGDS